MRDAIALPVTGARLSLWRAATLLRLLALAFCLFLILRWRHIYAHPALALLVGLAMIAVTASLGWLALRGRAHRPAIVWLDLAVTVILTLASIPAQTSSQRLIDGMPTLTTVWAVGPVVELAFVYGQLGGLVAAAIQFAAALAVRDGYDGRTLTNGFLLLVVGAVTGYVARLVVHAEQELSDAVALRAASAERDRLARSVHDGALQLLALVHRRGAEAGGDWAELGAAAAAQESALRRLVSGSVAVSGTATSAPHGRADLVSALRVLGADRVTLALPADAVLLDPRTVREAAAATQAALDNVVRHAGSHAHAWVLLEDLDDRVEITIRDDGPGICVGRLVEAAAQGRLGVRQSIEGRIEELGGRAEISSGEGAGTVVLLAIPRRQP